MYACKYATKPTKNAGKEVAALSPSKATAAKVGDEEEEDKETGLSCPNGPNGYRDNEYDLYLAEQASRPRREDEEEEDEEEETRSPSAPRAAEPEEVSPARRNRLSIDSEAWLEYGRGNRLPRRPLTEVSQAPDPAPFSFN